MSKAKSTKISQEEWDEARTVFFKILNDFPNQDRNIQAQMKTMGEVILENMNRLENQRSF
jgi:hypothetical protein